MNTFLVIVIIALAFEAGAVSAWLAADRFFIRPARAERDRAVRNAKKAAEITQLAMTMHSIATKEKREAKKNGLIMSPIQMQFPGERNDED